MNLKLVEQIYTDYQNAPHDPDSRSYRQFIVENIKQFDLLVQNGWDFSLSDNQPYASIGEMFSDCAKHRLKIWTGGTLAWDNPLTQETAYTLRGTYTSGDPYYAAPILNEICRAVHDINSHYKSGEDFSFEGEVKTWESEKGNYSSLALPAAYSESIGQLCYNYVTGKFVEYQENRIIPVRDLETILD